VLPPNIIEYREEENMRPSDVLFEELAQWVLIQERESKKYLAAYEYFYQLKDAYLHDPTFTRPDQDRNHAWLADSRTKDQITAMKDAWGAMQAASATIQRIQVQLDHTANLHAAVKRLRTKAAQRPTVTKS